uniref:Uncharacterized protein n=1 Tax=Timema genevievae TaxID=629358 RepID=A0A7R9K5G1_TIMGE|nr:unnamed protein product [Timema genevievae]
MIQHNLLALTGSTNTNMLANIPNKLGLGHEFLLGDNTNKFLNENWEVLAKDLGPFIAEGIAAAIKQIAAGLMDKVPYDDLLPENV